jgi:probable rRNA maturation factor
MSLNLSIRNRQRTRAVDVRLLRRMAKALLGKLLQVEQVELGISLVAAPEMTRLNETFLRHAGSTDVITFDYNEPSTFNPKPSTTLHGEIFICVDEAIAQARRFRTTWQSEVMRYLVHGMLHLRGHDDAKPAARRKMKREENRLLRLLASRFAFGKLSR